MTQPPDHPAHERTRRDPFFDFERQDREAAAVAAVVGPRPADDTPLWQMHPYWAFPTGRIDDSIRARLRRVPVDEAVEADRWLFTGRRRDRGYLLRRGERAYAVYHGGAVIATHTGERLFVAIAHRRKGVGLMLARVMLEERWWQVGVRFTPVALRVHQRAYRHIILDAMLRGDEIHPAILELLALVRDGDAVSFTPDGPQVR